MTTTTSTMTAPQSFGAFPRIKTMMESFRRNRADQRAIRQTFNELSAMTDRDLADIGVTRGDIRHIAIQATARR